MAKKKKKDAAAEQEMAPQKEFVIMSAQIKDDICDYSYKLNTGPGAGRTHSVKPGEDLIEEDMKIAFGLFNAHLAFGDDAFRRSGISVDDIDKFHSHELTSLYVVTGFKIKGEDEGETVQLIGTKYSEELRDRFDISTPRIPIGEGSGYTWYNELKQAVENARTEVEEYQNGKCHKPEKDEETNPNQLTIEELDSAKVD